LVANEDEWKTSEPREKEKASHRIDDRLAVVVCGLVGARFRALATTGNARKTRVLNNNNKKFLRMESGHLKRAKMFLSEKAFEGFHC
jgi:hypothetical protein